MIDFFTRLDMFLKIKGLNDNKFTLETGLSNGLIGKARIRGSLSQDNISKILCKYPELDADWLLTGRGKMLKKPSKPAEDEKNYKELAESRAETIELLKEKIALLTNTAENINGPSVQGGSVGLVNQPSLDPLTGK